MLVLALLRAITDTMSNLLAVVALDFSTFGVFIALRFAVFGNVAQF
jgi:hypothetical protein